MSKSDFIRLNFIEARQCIDDFINDDRNISSITAGAELILQSIRQQGKIMSCGNGGSMCDAIHFAEELSGRFRENRPALPALAISDPGHITCTGNDYGFEFIFSRYIEALGNSGDILFAISTSGNSKNILKAAEAAKLKKMKVIGLTGKDGGKLAQLCDVEIRAPHSAYADRTQEMHIKIIHSIIQYIEIQI